MKKIILPIFILTLSLVFTVCGGDDGESDNSSHYFTVTNGDDSGPGSLRQAIADASFRGGTIDISDSVNVIELTSRISIRFNFTINGNGVTLTRHSSWTTVGPSSQLLLVQGANDNTSVTINRIHFKGGKATNEGAAILNYKDSYTSYATVLTLESCIFSENSVTGNTYARGGAINNKATLYVKGCTFYNNSTSGTQPNTSGGGAIFNSGTLILEGNLFYINKNGIDINTYLVLNDMGNVPVTSNGYNAVDVAPTNNGWGFHTTDKSLAALGITSSPFNANFVPVTELRSFITAEPEDFPVADFYGDLRIFPGAPGAVK